MGDSGVRSRPERLARVFEPDFSATAGAGLGLAQAHAIAVRHGGRLEVTSEPGRGHPRRHPPAGAAPGRRGRGAVTGRMEPISICWIGEREMAPAVMERVRAELERAYGVPARRWRLARPPPRHLRPEAPAAPSGKMLAWLLEAGGRPAGKVLGAHRPGPLHPHPHLRLRRGPARRRAWRWPPPPASARTSTPTTSAASWSGSSRRRSTRWATPTAWSTARSPAASWAAAPASATSTRSRASSVHAVATGSASRGGAPMAVE